MTPPLISPKTLATTRFVVGIDLGTTNVAVSYADSEGDRVVRQFPIPQLTHPGELDTAALLPAFCYLPGSHELPSGALDVPWKKSPGYAVGSFARDQGSAVPGRLVTSAKSWLAHAGVERTRPILPWGSDLGAQKVSPVDVSFYYLAHIREAWDQAFADQRDADGTPCVLAEQQVVLTVPASFDEAARELTVEAATRAGLQHLVLIEEPLAAFYCWLWQNEDSWRRNLAENETILVVDVGGGTTDFSLIEVEPGYTLRRTAVGDHLLLGGDNMDMRLARQAETAWGGKLPAREWSLLCQECRKAKEQLLAAAAPASCDITVAGSGSSVIAATRSFTFERDAVAADLLEGFFPAIPVDAPAPERRRGIREMGLPYAADPAVTRHLLQFLRLAAQRSHPPGLPLTPVSRILFNGGAMLPETIRRRVAETVARWCGRDEPIPHLHTQDLNLAVSKGAAYYGLVRRGNGVPVKGGIARAYYLEIGSREHNELICIMPRDTDEEQTQNLEQRLTLRTNQPVVFPLYSSATRLGDRLGDVIADQDAVSPLPPLTTVLRYGRQNIPAIQVQVAAKLNAVGTLDLWLKACESTHTYPLSFDLRKSGDDGLQAGMIVEEEYLAQAVRCSERTFAPGGDPKSLPAQLEDALALPRKDWGLLLLRRLADALIKAADGRTLSAEHEARWLNLTGFTMRPGFGCAGDDWRARELWKLWHSGPAAKGHPQVRSEWWVFWRRLAGGLRSGQQQQIAGGLIRDLATASGTRLDPKKRHAQEVREMWRCLGALERLSPEDKTRILKRLLDPRQHTAPHHYWVIARAGARKLFHGPANAVVPAAILEPLLPDLFKAATQGRGARMALFAVANLCRLTGIRDIDVSDTVRAEALALLNAAEAPTEWARHVAEISDDSAQYQAEIAGENLPLGLVAENAPDETQDS